MPDIWQDELAIQKLTFRWHDANNRRNTEEFVSFFLEDGVWAAGAPDPFAAKGREKIGGLYQKLCDKFPFFFTMPHCPVIDVAGDEAKARWHMYEVAMGPDRKFGMVNYAIYEDHLVRVGGDWRFKLRFFNYLFLDKSPLPAAGVIIPLTRSVLAGDFLPEVGDTSIDPHRDAA